MRYLTCCARVVQDDKSYLRLFFIPGYLKYEGPKVLTGSTKETGFGVLTKKQENRNWKKVDGVEIVWGE